MPKSSEDSRITMKGSKKKAKLKSCDYADPEDNYPGSECGQRIQPSIQIYDTPTNWTTNPRNQVELDMFNNNLHVKNFMQSSENMANNDTSLCGVNLHFKNLYSLPLGTDNHNSFSPPSHTNSPSYWWNHAQSVPTHSRWTTNYVSYLHMMENQQDHSNLQQHYDPNCSLNAASVSKQAQQKKEARDQREKKKEYFADLAAEWSDISDASEDEQLAPIVVGLSSDRFVPVNSSIEAIIKANSDKANASTKPTAHFMSKYNFSTANSDISKSVAHTALSKEQIEAEMEYSTSKMELLHIKTQNNNKNSILLDLQCEAARQQLEELKFEKDAAEKTLMPHEQQLHLMAKRKKITN